jgi:hypothetical protein
MLTHHGAIAADIKWIAQTLDREYQRFGTRLALDTETQLVVTGPGKGS